MAKSAEAFRTISEVADWLELPSHVLRFWESKFTQVKPVKRAGGRRYYRPADMLLLGGIKKLLHDDGMTIKGAQKVLRESGVKAVAALSPPLDSDLADAVETSAAQPAPVESAPMAGVADAPFIEAEETQSEVISFTHRTADATPAEEEETTAADTPAEAPAEAEVPATKADAAPEATATPEAEPLDAPAEEAPPLRTSASGLPSFLQTGDQAEAPSAPASLSISLPDDPSDTDMDVDAGLLSRLAAFHAAPDTETRRALEQARSDLKALAS